MTESRPANILFRNAMPVLLVLIIGVYLYNGIHYIQSQSITSDEGSFYNYAVRYLKGSPDRIHPRGDNSKMPVAALNTIPRIIEQIIRPDKQKTDMGVTDMMNGRYITLLFSVFILLLVFQWARELYGKAAGVFAAFLFSFCPNNLAAATLVTTDSYAVFFLLLSMYLLWKFCKTGSTGVFLFLSISVAVSQLVKQSLFHLYILVPLCLLIFFLIFRKEKKGLPWVKLAVFFCIINLLVINAGYYFHHSFMQLGDYHFMSNLFLSVQKIFPTWLPLPFPQPFVDGLDMAKYYDQIGGGIDQVSSFGKVTILGQSFTGRGIWYYYFISILFKTPLSYFFFLFAAVFYTVRNKSLLSFIRDEFFLIIPVLYFLFLMSFLYQTQCGIRHIIFIYPFLFIWSAAIIPKVKRFSAVGIAAGCIFLVGSVMGYHGNYYSYTNELITDKKMAYEYVGAGNLDFMHGQKYFQKYLKEHKEVKWVTSQPETGIFLITVEDYMDIWNRHQYDWITSFKPIDHVAHCGLLIRVTEKDLEK